MNSYFVSQVIHSIKVQQVNVFDSQFININFPLVSELYGLINVIQRQALIVFLQVYTHLCMYVLLFCFFSNENETKYRQAVCAGFTIISTALAMTDLRKKSRFTVTVGSKSCDGRGGYECKSWKKANLP